MPHELYSKKILILLRHAEQDRSNPSLHGNGSLSSRGKTQALTTARELHSKLGKRPLALFSSPKKRCLETIEVFAELSKQVYTVAENLEECRKGESIHHFIGRIRNFIEDWKKSSNEITIACSHSDWIPEAVRMLVPMDFSVKHAAYIEVEEEKKVAEIQFRVLSYFSPQDKLK